MEKFIILNESDKKYISADILYAELNSVSTKVTIYYKDSTAVLSQSSPGTAADAVAINDAVAAVWAQGYTEATIGPIKLSSAVTTIA